VILLRVLSFIAAAGCPIVAIVYRYNEWSMTVGTSNTVSSLVYICIFIAAMSGYLLYILPAIHKNRLYIVSLLVFWLAGMAVIAWVLSIVPILQSMQIVFFAGAVGSVTAALLMLTANILDRRWRA
jgi:uncharacterized membrane protein